MNKKSFFKKVKNNRQLLLMLMPAILMVVVFSYIPMGGIIIAFKRYNYSLGIFHSEWNGLANFRFLFISGKLWELTRNTILYNLVFIATGTVFELTLAIVINEMGRPVFKKVTQSMMLLPHFISWVVAATIMLNLFGDNGVVSAIVKSITGEKWSLYSYTEKWPIVMVLVKMWKSSGYGSVVYLAAIVGIAPEMYEAAKIDGANIWQRIFKITLPSLKPTVVIMLLLAVGGIFRGDFGMFYQLVGNNQLLLKTSDILDTYIYRSMMSASNMGQTAAAGLYQSVLCFITINLFNFIVKKIEPDYALY